MKQSKIIDLSGSLIWDRYLNEQHQTSLDAIDISP
jgi:hypothetical protein